MQPITTRSARLLALATVVVLMAAGWQTALAPSPGVAAVASSRPHPAGTGAQIMYAASGHLWLRRVDGGPAVHIRTPWWLPTGPDVYPDFQWSPDHRRVALDDRARRLAVINLATGHAAVLARAQCGSNCIGFNYAWSPAGRYLAYIRPSGDSTRGTLFVWDSARGTTRKLLADVSGFASGIDWSHGGTRILVSTGAFDVAKSIFPSATVVSLAGHARVLTRGIGNGWSPDDRFVGVVRSHECGANTCDDAELVAPSAGGAPILLTQHIASTFEDPEWAQGLPAGVDPVRYAFDRWLLDSSGHVVRQVAGPHERIDSWSPDGFHVAVQSYHPYESTPDALFISVAPLSRQHVHLYTAGRKDSCGACSKDVYSVTWSPCEVHIAVSTPEYPTPSNVIVYPKIYVGTASALLARIAVPGTDTTRVVAFADRDRELIVQAGRTLYRYVLATRTPTVIVRGITALATPATNQATCA